MIIWLIYTSLTTKVLPTLVVEATVDTDEAVEAVETDEAVDISDTFVSSDNVEALRGRVFRLLGSGLPDLLDILAFFILS